jgi:asparagine synthase (glutamine-hydrolysing)
MFSTKEISELMVDSSIANYALLALNPSLSRNLNAAEWQALFDIDFYLKDDLLTKVDRASMRYSLEARVPILDHTVVEFALNLDPKLKVKNGTAKYLLKQVLYDHVPKQIFDRPKWGFSIPLDKWLKKDLSYIVEEYLNEKAISESGILKWSEVNSILTKWRSGQNHLYNRIWLMVLLQKWFTDNHQLTRKA